MSEADIELVQSDRLSPRGGHALQAHKRLAARIGQHLNVAPGDSAHTCPKSLHYGFFRGESGCEFADPAATVGDFERGIDPLEEAPSVPLEHATYPRYLDDVDADGMLWHAAPPARARQPAARVSSIGSGLYQRGSRTSHWPGSERM